MNRNPNQTITLGADVDTLCTRHWVAEVRHRRGAKPGDHVIEFAINGNSVCMSPDDARALARLLDGSLARAAFEVIG